MKKLMFALVAAGAAAVMGDAIESQNIVGYTVKTNVAWSILGPDFIACNGTEDMTLNDLAVNCDEENESITGWAAMVDSICVLTSAGNAGPALVYVPQYIAGGITEEIAAEGGDLVVTKGWYSLSAIADGDYTTPVNAEIEFGKGILVNISSGALGAGINFSGQVKTTPTITDVENWMPLVNCAPKDIKLNNIKVNCDEEEESITGWAAMVDSICVLTSAGNAGPALVYVPQYIAGGITEEIAAEGGDLVVTKGWYSLSAIADGDYTTPVNPDIQAGQGFLANASSGAKDITVQIDPAITVTP